MMRRRVDPHEAALAAFGFYDPKSAPSPMPAHTCGRCGEAKATVKDDGGLCLSCNVAVKRELAELVGPEEGPF